MKEELITFETAKLAYEKGFDEKTINLYVYDKIEKKMGYCIYNWKLEERGHDKEESYDIYKKPTQALLQKWLRENHLISIWFEDWDNNQYGIYINKEEDTVYMPNKCLGTYEKALEHALQKALKFI